MHLSFVHDALRDLLRLCRDAEERGTETHAYLLGRRSPQELIVSTVIRVGKPVEQAAMTRADYAASACAMRPLLDRGLVLLGEAHRHAGLRGLSAGDRRTLLSVPDRFLPYVAVVVTTFGDGRDPHITAATVVNAAIIDLPVNTVQNAYPVLLTEQAQRALVVGAGSGLAAQAPQYAKLPLHLTILDDDVVERRNLDRHLLTARAVGKKKARAIARFLRERTKNSVRAIDLAVTPKTRNTVARLIAEHDFVINATGHPPTSIILSELCAAAEKVCIHAGVFVRGQGGMVFVQVPGGATYLDLYDLQQRQVSDDAATLALLAEQYGFSESDVHAVTGLWSDVAVVAAVQQKVIADYLKYGVRQNAPNLYVIDNDQLAIHHRHIQPKEEV